MYKTVFFLLLMISYHTFGSRPVWTFTEEEKKTDLTTAFLSSESFVPLSCDITSQDIAPYADNIRAEGIFLVKQVLSYETLSSSGPAFFQNGWESLADIAIFTGRSSLLGTTRLPEFSLKIQEHFLWVGPYVKNGVAAISKTISIVKQKFPNLTNKEIKECLLESADHDMQSRLPKNLGGKGVFNHDSAMLYASLKSAQKTKLSELDKEIYHPFEHRLSRAIEKQTEKSRNLRTEMLSIKRDRCIQWAERMARLPQQIALMRDQIHSILISF